MDKKEKLIYIGNALAVHNVTPTSADIMPGLFREEGYDVLVFSSKRSLLLRMLDMLGGIVCYARSTDVVLIDTYSTKNFWYAFFCARLCQLLPLKYIPILHGGSLPQRMDRSPHMTKAILANAHAIVTPSRYLQEEIEQRGYESALIPNTIPVAEYRFKERRVLRPRLFFVRAFAGLYNPQMALYVLKALLKDYPEAELCMVGPDKDGTLNDCKTLAKDLGIEKKVMFPGRLSKAEWHKLSEEYDVFINTTNKDNTPVSVIEAMALGLPVVSTNPGGVSYLIDDGKDGLLVDCDDVNTMVKQINRLLKRDEKALSIARVARTKAEGFDWECVKERWESLLSGKE
ncbi:MAG: glycosyltransferase family 4 protein [Candidatus Aenigmarchaeota archaeon]|nr:glycosyltransferase family 4 protein [Candidatus Aenigmarchaeota archaeon]